MPGTTPVYGFPYPEPTDLVADYPALGQQLAEDIEDVLPTVGGLTPVAPTSIANSGGSASTSGNTTTFTGVSSISLNGIFTSSANNYRLVWTFTGSASSDGNLRLRAAGSDNTTSNYTFAYSDAGSGVNSTGLNSAQTSFLNIWRTGGSSGGYFLFDIMNPQLSERTYIDSHNFQADGNRLFRAGGNFTATTSFDGITLYPGSGTITGRVSVYAYKK